MLKLYRVLTTLAWPLILVYLGKRLRAGKEDPLRFNERLGRSSSPRPKGKLLWMHAASVGESLSLLALIEHLRARRPGLNLMVTTGTVTSAQVLAERLPKGVIHQFMPFDTAGKANRFLDHWKPDLTIWVESEFWPNMLSTVKKRKIPSILINGRVSAKSFGNWKRVPGVIKELLSTFSLALGQTPADADRLAALGAVTARSVGNLKFAAPPLPVSDMDFKALRDMIKERPVWLAASTWPGEEAIAARAHLLLKAKSSNILTIIVPRHPVRAPEILDALRETGLSVARRSAGQPPGPDTDIYLADTIGELGLFMRLAQVVFMGKSLTAPGGQNPIEPARLGRPVLFGPKMDNFDEVRHRMIGAGAAIEVSDAGALEIALANLIADPARMEELGTAARTFAEREAYVVERVMEELAPYLEPLAGLVRDRTGAP